MAQRRDDQSFDVDIEKVYKNFIVEIDNLKSMDQSEQTESRCHAFYRLLGLPVSDGQSLYSPGLDKPNNNDTDMEQTKSNISDKIQKDHNMLALLDARENYPRNNLSIFTLQDINATVLAMSSVDIREFAAPFKNSDNPFNTDKRDQQHIVDLVGRIAQTVTDSSGNKATNYSSIRAHFLKPLMVNPIIDSNVKPARNRLAVPFLKDKSEVKLNDTHYLKRPYIEKVCRDRFTTSDKVNNLGSHTKEILENIKNTPSISDDVLIKSLNPNNITSEQVQFANYINIIRSMLLKLSQSVNSVTRVLATDPNNRNQAKFNWYPIPSKSGPEQSCATRDLSQQPNDPFNTPNELQIIDLQYQEELKSISNKLLQDQKVDLGGFAFDHDELTPDGNSSDSFGNTLTNPIETALSQRATMTDAANEGLRTIEIIMGEFSGLGLCDILALCTALWIVDSEVLLNLIDETARNRMAQDPTLKTTTITPDIPGSLQKFEQKVKEVFELMDKMYRDIRSENTR